MTTHACENCDGIDPASCINTTGGTDDLSALREEITRVLERPQILITSTERRLAGLLRDALAIWAVLEQLQNRVEEAATETQTQQLRVIDHQTAHRAAIQRAEQAEQERDALQQLIDRWPDQHVKLRLLGETGDPPCADWCHQCAIERAEKAEAELTENTGVLQALRRQRNEAEAALTRAREAAAPIRQGLRDVAEYGEHGWYGHVSLDDVRELVAAIDQTGDRP